MFSFGDFMLGALVKRRANVPTAFEIAAIYAKVGHAQALEDALFDEWWEGPGKDWPTHTVMMRRIEGAPLEPWEEKVEGWIPAFYEWAKTRGLNGQDGSTNTANP